MDDVQTVYVSRGEEPGDAPLPELAVVAVTMPVVGMDGVKIPAGAEGTIVGTWRGGAAYEVEFPEPYDDVATVEAGGLRRVG